jgi:hypothetical protein
VRVGKTRGKGKATTITRRVQFSCCAVIVCANDTELPGDRGDREPIQHRRDGNAVEACHARSTAMVLLKFQSFSPSSVTEVHADVEREGSSTNSSTNAPVTPAVWVRGTAAAPAIADVDHSYWQLRHPRVNMCCTYYHSKQHHSHCAAAFPRW